MTKPPHPHPAGPRTGRDRPQPPITAGDDAVLDNHRMTRDTGTWRCVFCGKTEPDGPCFPRRWGDQELTNG